MKKLLAIVTMSMFAATGAFAASHMKAADAKKDDKKMEAKKEDKKMDKKDAKKDDKKK